MKMNLNVETGRRHSSTSLPLLKTTRTAATNSMPRRFRRRLGPAPLALLALLALALTVSVHEASAQGPPTATTLDATGVSEYGATLNGTFNPNGDPMALAWFEWSGGSTRPVTASMGTYVSAEVGAAHGPPLTAGMTYYFQLVAANQWGTAYGGENSFTTPGGLPHPPTVVTLPATEVTSTSATLNCTVNPNGGGRVWFEWGTNIAYGNQTSYTDIGTGTNAVPFSAQLVGLTTNTTYHFRADAAQGMISLYGGDQSFTTRPTQFIFTTNNGTITITGYTGPGGAVTIPDTINGLPVTRIGNYAFYGCGSLTSVTIGNGVTSIGESSFTFCISLTNVTIGNSVTNIEDDAFCYCTSLTALHFGGNAPSLGSSSVFTGDDNPIVYYLPGTTGWGTTFGGRPTTLWFLPNPLILTSGPSFGLQSNAFGFIISWATNLPVVVEACTNPANHSWSPLKTNDLTGGWSYFSDAQWADYPGRFYRVRSP